MRLDRRSFTFGALALGAAPALAADDILRRTIHASGETVPALGMGSWRTFDVGSDVRARRDRADVLRAFFAAGGRMIDSSPMYGSSQEVIGACLDALGGQSTLFAADKVWTPGGEDAAAQITRSHKRWGVARFDLLQVHNLVDWRRHLATLFQMRADGDVRYVGVTTYAGLRHDDVEQIAKSEPIDFIQLTYNILDRDAETRLLPIAQERGIAVIANRPFREGALFAGLSGRPLPGVAATLGVASWAAFMLKFVISQPSITCAIPATGRVDHMKENMQALRGPQPDQATRLEMARIFAAL